MFLPQGQPLGKTLFKCGHGAPRAQGIGTDFIDHGLVLHGTGASGGPSHPSLASPSGPKTATPSTSPYTTKTVTWRAPYPDLSRHLLPCRLPPNIGRSFRVSTLGAVIACCGRSSREDRVDLLT